MGMVQLPDELQRVIERQVAEGRAASPTAFLEEAVRRLIDDGAVEENELRLAVEAGSADIASGRYRTVATPDDERRLLDDVMTRLRSRRVVADRLTGTAEDRLDALLDGARDHGLEAASRYGWLILAVMAALGDKPYMIGSTDVPRLAGIHAYPTRLGRRRIANPRHIIVYRPDCRIWWKRSLTRTALERIPTHADRSYGSGCLP